MDLETEKPELDPTDVMIGAVGLALGLWYASMYWRTMTGAGDNNPVAVVYLFGALVSAVPTWGLWRAMRRPGATLLGAAWSFLSVCCLALLGVGLLVIHL